MLSRHGLVHKQSNISDDIGSWKNSFRACVNVTEYIFDAPLKTTTIT
jgi:hypothetical protein